MAVAEHLEQEQLSFGPVDPNRPDLLDMFDKLHHYTTAFSYQEFVHPQTWYGVSRGEKTLAAYGFNVYPDDTIEIRYAVCQPSKEGLRLLASMAGLLAKAWEGRRVVFHVQASNLRMRRIVEALGSKPIALLYEWRRSKEGG